MARRLRIILLSLIVLLLCLLSAASFLTFPPGAAAQTSCTGGGVVTLIGVDPSSISNSSAVTITVIGDGFENGAVVVLQGYSALQTTFVSTMLLRADVPAGIPGTTTGQSYDVLVYNPTVPETNCAVLTDALTVYSTAPTAQPTGTSAPTTTPVPTNFVRPAITVQSYGASSKVLLPGEDIDFEITLQNLGQITATNIIVTFVSGDLIPRVTGGVQAIPDLPPGQTYRFFQPLRVDSNLWDYEAILHVEVEYTDQHGEAYKETFELSFPVYLAGSTATPVPTATPTPTLSVRPDIIIETYDTEPDVVTVGNSLRLNLDLVNASPETARQIIIRLNPPQASPDILALLSSSNERYIDQLVPGARTQVSYDLAVSGDADAGLVPIEFELSYIDNYNIQYTEIETLSLRIDAVPFLYVNLFQAVPEVINVGDSFELPIQVINIGQVSININTIVVTSDLLEITNGSVYLGKLDSGTSGSMIAQARALESGTATVLVHVNYLDAFQQPQVYVHEMTFEVQGVAASQGQPDAGSAVDDTNRQRPGAAQEMTVWQRIKQALLGFFGLAVQSQSPRGGFPGGGAPGG